MDQFINLVPSPKTAALADELRNTWRMIEIFPPNELRIAIFYEQMELYLLLFGMDSEGRQWDKRYDIPPPKGQKP